MKILYLDLSMGAAGDMLTAALLGLHPSPETVLERLRAMKLPGVTLDCERSESHGISGLHFVVRVDGSEEDEALQKPWHHHGRHLGEVLGLIDQSGLPAEVCEKAKEVFQLLGEAESFVHGETMEHIHFHEVGSLDAIVDITACCLLIHELKPDRICASPIHVGSGTVRCAHGELPVPAPATARLLEGVPIYGGELQGELCTPTGAALLTTFVDRFEPLPPMRPVKSAYGLGSRDFGRPNVLRASLGEADERVTELLCSLDDMSGEAIGFALTELMDAGALDVSWQSVGMKKSRPGVLLRLLCRETDRDKMVRLLFKTTSTIGMRETLCRRYVLRRREGSCETSFGSVRYKVSEGYGVRKEKIEADDLAAIAREQSVSLDEAKELLRLEEYL